MVELEREAWSRATARRLWRGNFVAIVRGNVARAALGLTAGLTLARVLDPEGRGLLAIALTWVSLLVVFLGLGTNNSAAFFASRHPGRHGEVLRAGCHMLVISCVVILALGVVGSTIFAHDRPQLYTALLVAFAATPFMLLTAIGRGMLKATNLKAWSRLRLVQPEVYTGAVVLLAISSLLTVTLAATAFLVSQILSALWVWWKLLRKVRLQITPDFCSLRREMFRYGLKSSISGSANITNVRLDVTVLAIVLPPSQVGIYAVASSLAQYIVPLATAAEPWVFPRIANTSPSEGSLIEARRAIRITALLAILGAVSAAGTAPFLLGRILGPEWLPTLVPLWILLAAAVVQSVRRTQISISSALNRPGLAAQSEGAAAIVTVASLWPMVQWLGVNGAAIVSVLAYMVSALLLHRGILSTVRTKRSVAHEPQTGDS